MFTAVVYIKMSDQMLTLTSRVHDDVDYHRDQLSERKQIALYKQLDSYGSTGSKKVSRVYMVICVAKLIFSVVESSGVM